MKLKTEDVLRKKVIKFGNSGHIILNKNLIGRIVYVLFPVKSKEVEIDPRIPKKVHKGFWKEYKRMEKEFKEIDTKDGYWPKHKKDRSQ